jgi:hypothetical protein
MSGLIDSPSPEPRVSNILTELDNFIGTDIHVELPNDGDLVKLKVNPTDEGEDTADKEFVFGKIHKIFKGNEGEVRVDGEQYDILFELTIRQYVLGDNVTYNKWSRKTRFVLGDINKWKKISQREYDIINYAFDPPQPQPEPEQEENPLTPYVESVSGGRRRSNRKSRKSKRKSHKSKRR